MKVFKLMLLAAALLTMPLHAGHDFDKDYRFDRHEDKFGGLNCPDLPEPQPGLLLGVSGIMAVIFALGYKLGQENQKHKLN